MGQSPQDKERERQEKRDFLRAIGLMGTVFVVQITLGVSVQECLVVLWQRGWDAYFSLGIRIRGPKPLHFTDGVLVSGWSDFVFGVVVFLLTFVITYIFLAMLERKIIALFRKQSAR